MHVLLQLAAIFILLLIWFFLSFMQRGDAEMENRMNRLMRACCDLGDQNPIVSVHDQGAGGNGNVLKEIVEPAGAEYDIRKVSFIIFM